MLIVQHMSKMDIEIRGILPMQILSNLQSMPTQQAQMMLTLKMIQTLTNLMQPNKVCISCPSEFRYSVLLLAVIKLIFFEILRSQNSLIRIGVLKEFQKIHILLQSLKVLKI